MEENLLKYFTGNGEIGTKTIMPQNIENKSFVSPNTFNNYNKTIVSNDGNYFIRYGGTRADNTGAIEVYDEGALYDEAPLYNFNNITIEGRNVFIRDLKQDEDGRFYGIGYQWGAVSDEYYLILFNNFIQDKELKIRKFYSRATMGITFPDYFSNVIKKNGSADYFLSSTYKIFHYKIDISEGNTLKVVNINNGGSITTGTVTDSLNIIDNTLILMQVWISENRQQIPVTYDEECTKLIIDINSITNGDSYTTQSVYSKNIPYYISISAPTDSYTYKVLYPDSGLQNFKIDVIDLSGNIKTFQLENILFGEGGEVSFCENYVLLQYNEVVTLLYYNPYDTSSLVKFAEVNMGDTFVNTKIMKNFNLIYLVARSAQSKIVFSKNIYSLNYSSLPYYNNNFMIPQYLNIYSNANDDTSIIFSRDVSNRFLADNQLTATFNVPNYLLNDSNIQREDVFGQTNLTIQTTNNQYSKNRFESLYFNYIYNLYINDNTNGDNLTNSSGANRLADSIWNRLDYQDSPLAKARITYEDGSQSILNLNIINVSGNSHTFEYEVTGNINKIEYMSSDEETVYATYRCNLTGTNTISQTITIEEG